MDLNQSRGCEASTNFHQIESETTILITNRNCKRMNNHKGSMQYYDGEVRYDGGLVVPEGVKAIILCFESAEIAKNIHECLISVSHAHVMRSLGYGTGLKEFSRYHFLALPFFENTFEEFVNDTWKCVEMGRFNMQIIMIVGGIVRAMLALHSAGFCCKKLRSRDIAIVRQHKFICAKIWNFQKCTSDDDKDQDWVRLGKLLQKTNHRSTEAEDLYDNLLNGKIKGLDILKHSALLTTKKKFRNVLIFDFYKMTHWPEKETEDSKEEAEDSSENLEIVEAPSWLDESLVWKSQRKPFLFARALTDPPDTYRGFSTNLRHLTEHEVDFLPPEMTDTITFSDRQLGMAETDLEWHIRKCWPEPYLKVQHFVRTNNLNY